MLTILAAVFVFGVLVTVHEFGHFITAKLTGMRVDEFAIGFGPKLYQQKDGDTLYSCGLFRWVAIIKSQAWILTIRLNREPLNLSRYRPECWLFCRCADEFPVAYYSFQRYFYAGGQTGAGE